MKSTASRWARRLRIPVLLGFLSLFLAVGPAFVDDRLTITNDWMSFFAVTARVLAAIAIGWAITTAVDAVLKRRLGRLNLSVDDNLAARKLATRLDVMRRVWVVLGGLITLATAFTLIPGIKQVGVSLFASAGIAGLALGIAARPVLANLIAGIQIAFTQPIRIDDAVVVENEWGWIEEIGLFYVVIKVWDWRRLVVPISYFTEKPFQNWTRQNASIIGSVFWFVDYKAPIGAMRAKLEDICRQSNLWDGNVVNLQVSDADHRTLQVRALASARTSPAAWDLRCFIREEMIAWLQAQHPEALPVVRAETRFSEEAPNSGSSPTPPPSFTRDQSLDVQADQSAEVE